MTVLIITTLIGPLAVHIYIPIMPTIQQAFGVSTTWTTLTFSMTLFVMAFGTLIYGSASDRFGRRPVLMAGLILFVGGSAVCAVATSFAMLLVGRFLQALAAGCGVVLARAIARDVYGPDKLAQVIAYITVAYVLGPTIAPPVGGMIADLFGWHAVFIFATAVSLVVIVLGATVIGETHFNRQSGIRLASLLRDYAALCRNAEFMGYALNPAFTSGAFFALAIYASFLMRDHYHASSAAYGVYFMFYTLGFMLGNFISGRLGSRMRTEFMVVLGGAGALIMVGVMAAGATSFPDAPLGLFLPGALLCIAQGLSMPYAQAAAINAEPGATGTAAGAVMFLQFLSAAIASLFISTLYDDTFLPMNVVVSVLTFCALCSALLANRYRGRRLAREAVAAGQTA